MATGYSTLQLPDGAKLAYEIFGSFHLPHAMPIVLICGMSAQKGDWERLSHTLARSRPVLLYDHRGMGESTCASPAGDEFDIETLARDLSHLLTHLQWKEIALCGYSMGGVVAQQLLVLPYHPSKPTPLPFKVTHLILSGTRSEVVKAGLQYSAPASGKPRTPAERKQVVRRILEAAFDPVWLASNEKRLETLISRVMNGRPRNPVIIARQGAALRNFAFADLLANLPRDLQVLVIHGKLDNIIPFQCSQDILKRMPWAEFIQQGDTPGTVPSLEFGHHFYEYFEPRVWYDVVETFLHRKSTEVEVAVCPTPYSP